MPPSDSLMDVDSFGALYNKLLDRYQSATSHLPPAQTILLRSVALVAIVLTAFGTVCICWSSMYKAVVPREGRTGDVWLQYGHYRPPYAEVPLMPYGSYLSSDQKYDVTLDFVVPSTTRNIDVGNFMVNVVLLSSDRRTLVNVSRPASLSYRSPVSLTLAALSPLAFFRSPDTQRLSVSLISSEVLQTKRAVPTLALVEIGRRDAHLESGRWNGGSGEVQVYSAKLRFDAHLSGLRWFLYHHPILSFLIFTPLFLVLELVSALAIWAFITYRSTSIFGSPPSTASSSSTSQDDDDRDSKTKIKTEPLSTRALFEEQDREEERLAAEGLAEANIRAGVRMGGEESALGGLGETQEEEETASVTDVEEGGSGSSWDALEGDNPSLSAELTVKGDDDDEMNDAATLGGSTTTRGTTVSFGPSLASTSASTSTGASSPID